jgi:hypothetical protein
MLAAPAATAVTTPVDGLTVATDVVPLVHVPPVGVELSEVVLPAHMVVVPVIADGAELTLTTVVLVHPEPIV